MARWSALCAFTQVLREATSDERDRCTHGLVHSFLAIDAHTLQRLHGKRHVGNPDATVGRYGAVMRELVVPSWQPLQAPVDLELTGICFSPLALRTRMSAPARFRAEFS